MRTRMPEVRLVPQQVARTVMPDTTTSVNSGVALQTMAFYFLVREEHPAYPRLIADGVIGGELCSMVEGRGYDFKILSDITGEGSRGALERVLAGLTRLNHDERAARIEIALAKELGISLDSLHQMGAEAAATGLRLPSDCGKALAVVAYYAATNRSHHPERYEESLIIGPELGLHMARSQLTRKQIAGRSRVNEGYIMLLVNGLIPNPMVNDEAVARLAAVLGTRRTEIEIGGRLNMDRSRGLVTEGIPPIVEELHTRAWGRMLPERRRAERIPPEFEFAFRG